MFFGFRLVRVPQLIPLSTVNRIWESETPFELQLLDEPQLAGTDLRPREGHRLLGRRMPQLDLVTADGPRRVFELLHDTYVSWCRGPRTSWPFTW